MIEELLKYSPYISVMVALFTIAMTLITIKRNRVVKETLSLQYADIFRETNQMFFKLHQFNRKEKVAQHEWITIAKEFADGSKNLFDKITHSNCNVSIKVFVHSKRDISIKTLIRSSNAAIDREEFDERFGQRLADDTIAMSVFSGKAYYLDNDLLPLKKDAIAKKYTDWKMPYLSILTVPIKHSHGNKDDLMIGMLTITSDKRNAFSLDLDLSMAQGLADGMSDFLKYVLDSYMIK